LASGEAYSHSLSFYWLQAERLRKMKTRLQAEAAAMQTAIPPSNKNNKNGAPPEATSQRSDQGMEEAGTTTSIADLD
jgi:hypothetical protein